MPFTFSHPAIVLPLTYLPRNWYSLTGLVIGSLTPDFEYFLRMRIQSEYSHTLPGIFWFDLPLGLLLTFLFHNIVRDPLINNSPKIVQSRAANIRQLNWNMFFRTNWLIVVISILVGAFSHVLWDSFTHSTGYFVQKISDLSSTVELFNNQIPIYKILQHSSTFIGGLIIIIAFLMLPRNDKETRKIKPKYWITLTLITAIIIIIRIQTGLDVQNYGNIIVTAISAGLIGFIVTPIVTANG